MGRGSSLSWEYFFIFLELNTRKRKQTDNCRVAFLECEMHIYLEEIPACLVVVMLLYVHGKQLS